MKRTMKKSMKKAIKQCTLILVLLLTSCTSDIEPTLRLGTNVWPGYEPLYLARDRGALKEERVHLVELSSASQVIRALRNNLIDAAALTLDEVLSLLGSGEKLKIVLVMDTSNGADAIVAIPEIKTLTDIKGMRVGVEQNALGGYVISRALEFANLDRNSIEIVPIDIDEQVSAFSAHKIDVAVTFQPVLSKLIRAGGHIVFDSRQIPNEIVDVLVVKEEFFVNHPKFVEYLLNGWDEALSFMQENPRKAAQTLGIRMKLNIDETLQSYEGLHLPDQSENLRLLHQQPKPGLLPSAMKLMKFMVQHGLLNEPVDPTTLFVTFNRLH